MKEGEGGCLYTGWLECLHVEGQWYCESCLLVVLVINR